MKINPQIIYFDKMLVPSIIDKTKTCTIRYKEKYQLGPAIGKSTDEKTFFDLNIISISHVSLKFGEDGISSQILQNEAFDNISEKGFNQLVKNLKKYYPEILVGDPVSIISFKLV